MKDPAAIINNIRGIGHVHRTRGTRGPYRPPILLDTSNRLASLENVPSEIEF